MEMKFDSNANCTQRGTKKKIVKPTKKKENSPRFQSRIMSKSKNPF